MFDLEVAQALRRFVLVGLLSAADGATALGALLTLPLRRHAHARFLDRVWQFRENVSVYDASYVALAEELGATLLTRDARLAAAPGIRAAVELV